MIPLCESSCSWAIHCNQGYECSGIVFPKEISQIHLTVECDFSNGRELPVFFPVGCLFKLTSVQRRRTSLGSKEERKNSITTGSFKRNF